MSIIPYNTLFTNKYSLNLKLVELEEPNGPRGTPDGSSYERFIENLGALFVRPLDVKSIQLISVIPPFSRF